MSQESNTPDGLLVLESTAPTQAENIDVFKLSPLPMWIYELETLKFLDVNDAAVKHYGFSKTEFLERNLRDIRPSDEIPLIEKITSRYRGVLQMSFSEYFNHKKKMAR